MIKNFSALKKNTPVFSRVVFILFPFFFVIHLIFVASPSFSDLFNRTIGASTRFVFSFFSGLISFSLAEAVIIFSPAALVFYILFTVRCSKRSAEKGIRCVIGFISLIPLVYSLFVLTLAAGYYSPGIDEKMGFRNQNIDSDDLYDSAVYLTEKINCVSENVYYVYHSHSIMPYSNHEMIEKVDREFSSFDDEFGLIVNFRSSVKQIALSVPMTYTHISGVYSFFTGEANINVNYPDFILPFTTAHEIAHQRGISREDEANFVAYLICERSDDPFFRYSAYLNMLEYIMDDLYSSDINEYYDIWLRLNDSVRYDLSAYSKFFDAYRDSAASRVSFQINDAYLKAQGTEGVESYGGVVTLFVKYFKGVLLVP